MYTRFVTMEKRFRGTREKSGRSNGACRLQLIVPASERHYLAVPDRTRRRRTVRHCVSKEIALLALHV